MLTPLKRHAHFALWAPTDVKVLQGAGGRVTKWNMRESYKRRAHKLLANAIEIRVQGAFCTHHKSYGFLDCHMFFEMCFSCFESKFVHRAP